jgi:hypothetical protein
MSGLAGSRLAAVAYDNTPDPTQERQRRMLTRRTDLVQIPGGDRMPPQVLSPYTDRADETL